MKRRLSPARVDAEARVAVVWEAAEVAGWRPKRVRVELREHRDVFLETHVVRAVSDGVLDADGERGLLRRERALLSLWYAAVRHVCGARVGLLPDLRQMPLFTRGAA